MGLKACVAKGVHTLFCVNPLTCITTEGVLKIFPDDINP